MTTVVDGSAGVTTPALAVSGNASVGGGTSLNSTPAVTTPQSMVQLNTANGYGSTNIYVRRFSTVVANQGSDITYVDSATLGASFTINTAGVYAISYTDNFNSTANEMGITLNSVNQIIVGASALSAISTQVANVPESVSWTGYLPTGSVIRACTYGAASGSWTGSSGCSFTITRVA